MTLAEAANDFAWRVAVRIQARRLELGISKLALARKAGLDQRAITFVENHARVPSIVTLYRIASALDCSIEELIKD